MEPPASMMAGEDISAGAPQAIVVWTVASRSMNVFRILATTRELALLVQFACWG